MSSSDRNDYVQRADLAIRSLLREKECQPILFVGAGLSRRYFGAPGWHDALRNCLAMINDSGPAYEYYVQRFSGNLPKIGSLIADRVHEWAWSKGKKAFPDNLFDGNNTTSIFLKHAVAKQLAEVTPKKSEIAKLSLKDEIKLLAQIRAHAIITTNYDSFLENIFDGYAPIIGQEVIKYDLNSFGEIFKIHGTVEQPNTLILTEQDYELFASRQKYVAAKLLTYFAEHPVFIFGYSLNDPNISSIIQDLGEIIADQDGLISNIYYIAWDPDASTKSSLPYEHLVPSAGKQFRVKAVVTDDLSWVYTSLASDPALKSINTKLVRTLAARAYKLIRSDIPKGKFEVNYQVLESVVDNDDSLPNLLGITKSSNPNDSHPFVLTQVAEKLGYKHWTAVDKLIKKIKAEKGVDLRAEDNQYHLKMKSGVKNTSTVGKWSHSAIALFKLIQKNQPYQITL